MVYRFRILESNPAGYLDWIRYRFPFNRIRTRIIQMNNNVAVQKMLLWNNSCITKN